MSIGYTASYLILPNTKLRELGATSEELELLCESILVESQETSHTSRNEYALRVKIFILLHFTNEYLATAPAIAEFFAGRQLDEALFDSWWQLLPVEDDAVMPSYGQKYKVLNVPRGRVSATGSEVVEDWLARVVEFP